jgi:hypothetical protein
MLISAAHRGLSVSAQTRLDRAVGAWIQRLQVVLINERHPALDGLDGEAREAFLANVAWHEWGHALSVVRCSREDRAAGQRLLDLAPEGVRQSIRRAGYAARDYTHEVIAETYALLMARRIRGHQDQPEWLNDEIYSLVRGVTGWSQ